MSEKKTLLIVSSDKLGRLFLCKLPRREQFLVAVDKSTNFKRILKLIFRRRLSLCLTIKIFLAEVLRRDTSLDIAPAFEIRTNSDIRNLLSKYDINEVYLFRAGLIVNKKTLSMGARFINTHCAKIPEYAGIGVIDKALRERAYQQVATLHEVVESIDSGLVLKTLPYNLKPSLSYAENENIAYSAGIDLLLGHLNKIS